MEWIRTKDKLPQFNKTVLGYCPIYGRAVRVCKNIDNTKYPEWDDPINGGYGGLPPTHWMELPEPPAAVE